VAKTPAERRFTEGQVVTVFRSRRRPGTDSEYRALSREMQEAARTVPGFVDFKTFTAEDGEHVSLVTFATPEAHHVWRNDPRHRAAQKRGRDAFYLEYSIQVAECSHVVGWTQQST
jgi:heme-degrading monooxygenase HmoA